MRMALRCESLELACQIDKFHTVLASLSRQPIEHSLTHGRGRSFRLLVVLESIFEM